LKKLEEYLEQAAKCREMARTASPTHQAQLATMAETWEQLADGGVVSKRRDFAYSSGRATHWIKRA
jgi:ATP-dependent DNA ligase